MTSADKQLLLLGLLRIQKMHGYELTRFLEQHAGVLPSIKSSTAYSVLDRLAEARFVDSQAERNGNRPERQVYRITPAGERRFHELLNENLASYRPDDPGDDLGIAFLGELPVEEARGRVAAKREMVLAGRAKARRMLEEAGGGELVHLPLLRAAMRAECDASWLDRVETALQAGAVRGRDGGATPRR